MSKDNTNKDKVVGFKEEAQTIIDQLIRGPKNRDVVLITGMGGLGKTTLARGVYDEKKIVNYFDNRAWCTVSQEYDYMGLLHKIYNQVCGSETEIDDVAEKLRKSLMGKRYLIVLDDIWSVEAWEELNIVFPSCDNGSRIVLTSRQANLLSEAKHICLPFFTIDESWELLQVKLFKGEKCLEELENVGRDISKKCGGLPLVVGLVAGLLEGVEKKGQKWHEFLNTLNSLSAFRDGIQSNDAIELSYKHLPHHLKPCLLYFAAFPEDREIAVSKLIQLWISEGFIDTIEEERIEDKAGDYLKHLVDSNLIMVSQRKYDGCMVSCIVHDLIRDFCLSKVKEENFVEVINLENDLDPTTLNFTPHHRICFHRYKGREIPNGSWIVKKFEHLTVLDLEFIDVDKSILSEVNSLIHLRYLALNLHGGGSVSPLSLGNLECLITLKLRSGKDLHLPKFFWNITSLRHLIISHSCSSCAYEPTSVIEAIHDSETIHGSEDLQILDLAASLCLRDEILLRKLPHLKTLSCSVAPPYPSFAETDLPHRLESLKLTNFLSYPDLFNDLKLGKLPTSIKEINLRGITLSSSSMSIIEQLPNLEALTLWGCKLGPIWYVKEETQFRKLKYLELNDLPILVWNISGAECFPCLEQLILEACYYLRDLPSCLADISTLEVIRVLGCNRIPESSVKKIMEDGEEIGNEQLNVETCDLTMVAANRFMLATMPNFRGNS